VAAEIAVVGDMLGADILGAQLAGMPAIWRAMDADNPANAAHAGTSCRMPRSVACSGAAWAAGWLEDRNRACPYGPSAILNPTMPGSWSSCSALEQRFLPAGRRLVAWLPAPLVTALARRNVSPDAVSAAQIGVGALTALTARRRPRLTLGLAGLAVLLDGLDGTLARATGRTSRRGPGSTSCAITPASSPW
jgi:hypothetical protein